MALIDDHRRGGSDGTVDLLDLRGFLLAAAGEMAVFDRPEIRRRVRRPVLQHAGGDERQRSESLLIGAFSPGENRLTVSDGKNGREVLADIRLARAGGSFDESEAVLVDGSCGLIDEIRLEGLRRATGAGLTRRPPGRETGGLVNGPGDGLLGRDEAEEGPQDLERRLRPVPPRFPEPLRGRATRRGSYRSPC